MVSGQSRFGKSMRSNRSGGQAILDSVCILERKVLRKTNVVANPNKKADYVTFFEVWFVTFHVNRDWPTHSLIFAIFCLSVFFQTQYWDLPWEALSQAYDNICLSLRSDDCSMGIITLLTTSRAMCMSSGSGPARWLWSDDWSSLYL